MRRLVTQKFAALSRTAVLVIPGTLAECRESEDSHEYNLCRELAEGTGPSSADVVTRWPTKGRIELPKGTRMLSACVLLAIS